MKTTKTMFDSPEDAAAVLEVLERRLPAIVEKAKHTVDMARVSGLEVDRYTALVRVSERAIDYALTKNLVCVDAMKQAAWDEGVALNDDEMRRVHNAIHAAIDGPAFSAHA